METTFDRLKCQILMVGTLLLLSGGQLENAAGADKSSQRGHQR
jgi:hypothetical protein